MDIISPGTSADRFSFLAIIQPWDEVTNMSGKYGSRNHHGKHAIDKAEPLAIRMQEHHIFRDLFDEARQAQPKRLTEIPRELCMRLTVHMTIEEELFYPALKPIIGGDEINEGIVEHQSGKRIIAELEQLDGIEELYGSKVHVLGEETIHHIDEEDEGLFEDANKAHRAGDIDLDALGETLRARQAKLYDDIAATGETGRTCEAQPDEVKKA